MRSRRPESSGLAGWPVAALAAAAMLALTGPAQSRTGALGWAVVRRSRATAAVAAAAPLGRHVDTPRGGRGTMPAGVLAVPLGVGLVAGLGWALVVAGVTLVGVSLLAGWNA